MRISIYILFFLFSLSCTEPSIVYNIPSLIGKDIDDVRIILGTSGQDEPLDTSKTYWFSSYNKNGYLLSIKYNPKTRKINYFQIVSKEKEFSKYEEILKIGNLDSNSINYSLETDRSWNLFNNYDNVTVYPKNKY